MAMIQPPGPADSTTSKEVGPTIDVQRIVDNLQERVAERRAAGVYDPHLLNARLELRPGEVVLRPEIAYSSKRLVGPSITTAKRLLIRLNWHFLQDLTDQINAALALGRARVSAEARQREELEARVDGVVERIERIERSITGLGEDAMDHSSPAPAETSSGHAERTD